MGNEISKNLKRRKLILLVTWHNRFFIFLTVHNRLLMTQHMLNKIKCKAFVIILSYCIDL